MSYSFDLAQHRKSIIKVIGVGGGGSNAVNFMYEQGIEDVEFVVCNTDAQVLRTSPVPNKLQIGLGLTEGLGSGANPEKGRAAAEESAEAIRDLLSDNTKMVFITAGMGGGTGTGAAPVIAEIAKELGILTVGIVTAPFSFEGPKKKLAADNGIEEMKDNCDTVLVILNDKLTEMFGDMRMHDAYAQADNILTTAAKGIAEIITKPGYVNVDFEDVKTVMKDAGSAVMGSATASGQDRALHVAQDALSSPLLNNRDIYGAQRILLSMVTSKDHGILMSELSAITSYIQEKAGEQADIIYGHSYDETLGEAIGITVIATGFDKVDAEIAKSLLDEEFSKMRVIDLDRSQATQPIELNTLVTGHPSHEPHLVRQPVVAEQRPQPMYVPVAQAIPFPSQAEAQASQSIQQVVPVPMQPTEPTPPVTQAPEPPAAPAPMAPTAPPAIFGQAQKPVPAPAPLPQRPQGPTQLDMELARKRQILIEQGEERRRRMRMMGARSETDFVKLEEPAYQRHNTVLQEPAYSDQSQMSRYSLTDEQELLGNNKFLHDNVD